MSELKHQLMLNKDRSWVPCYLKSEADKVIAEKDKELRHQKYRRCLAMARLCNYWTNYWEGCIPSDCGMFIAKARFYRRWRKRWLKLAEKFKEAK